jgi:hypothetical protein
MAENTFAAEYAKTGRALCKARKCREKIGQGELRIAKVHPSSFNDGMTSDWHHPSCLFESFKRVRKGTKIISSTDDIEGFDTLKADDQELIQRLIDGEEEEDDDDDGETKKKTTQKRKRADPAPKKPAAAKPAPKAVVTKGPLSGYTFALSGTLSRNRKEIEAEIETYGGKVAKSITKAVNVVIADNPDGDSVKLRKARDDGKEIVGEEWLEQKIAGGSSSGEHSSSEEEAVGSASASGSSSASSGDDDSEEDARPKKKNESSKS